VTELERALKGGADRVYLLHGDAELLVRGAFDWLRGRVTGGVAEDFNLDRFDARDKPNPNRIVDAARTLPMMANRRLVWVRNAEALFALPAAQTTSLATYVEKADETTCLVFQCASAADRRSKLYRAVEKHGCVYEARTPSEREMVPWTLARLRDRGRRMEPDAAQVLVDAVGRDLTGIEAALERLCLFVEAPAAIGVPHVEQVVAHTRAHTVWELTDAVADRNVGLALAHAAELMGQGEAALKVLSLVADRMRKLVIGRAAKAQGATAQEMAQLAGMPSFKAADFARQVQKYEGAELLAALDRLSEADRRLKRSKLDDALILEALLIDLCAPRHA
jgi:DNA polymerase-3 subunit delta